jgi:hypothetical protein
MGLQGFPANWSNPFAAQAPDSGAILVGAGAPPGRGAQEPDASRMAFSNHSPRLDAQGWGVDVATTGGFYDGKGDLAGGPENRWYTKAFSGTSSATPIVAGALACVQGWLRAAGLEPLTPSEARQALRCTGPSKHQHRDETSHRSSAAGRTWRSFTTGCSAAPARRRHNSQGGQSP